MTVLHTANNQELEDEGEDELTVAAVRYTGPQSVYNTNALTSQGYFPSMGALQGGQDGPGPWVVALLPSKRTGYYENHADLEIAYDRETLAEGFLEKNVLPSPVFGPNVNQNIQDRVLDKLEIDRLPRRNDGIREELTEIAGEDVDAGEEADDQEFPYELTRSELWSVAKPLDPPFEWNGMQTTEAEEFLLEQDDETVRTLVNQLKQGDDPTLDEEDEDTGDGEEA